MTILCSQVRKIKSKVSVENLQAIFFYPKLVIFLDERTFNILNLDDKQEGTNNVLVYEMEHAILDKVLHNNLLWLLFKSGELLVIDVIRGSQIKVSVNNHVNYFRQLRLVDDSLFIITESEEILAVPSYKFYENLVEDVTEVSITLDKTYTLLSNLKTKNWITWNGLYVCATLGNIFIKCPYTDLDEIITCTKNIKDIVLWDELAILAENTNMWSIDLNTGNVIFEFENIGYNYYPLAAEDKVFYYLSWNEVEIHVYRAWKASAAIEEVNNSLNKSITKLSSQETLKYQLQCLVDAIVSGSESGNQEVMELKKLFDLIEDFTFLVQIASKLCEYNIMYKFVIYPLQKRLYSNLENDLIITLNDLMIKIDLLEYMNFRRNNSYKTLNIFEKNFKELCITFISESDLDLASICWLKYSGMHLKIVSDDIMDILNATPHNVKMGALVIWLKNFVPSLLDHNPYFIDLFVKWTTQRIFLIERSCYWPKIGLKFIDEIITVLDSSLKTIPIRPISIDDLDLLKDRIFHIMELKDKYKINMLLGEISSLSSNEVALIMLRRCYTEDLYTFVQDYLPAFATQNMFELDDTLRSYIENEAATCGGGVDSIRLKILLNAFRAPTSKLDCLLQVLKVLDVPWDNTVLELAVTAAASVYKDFTVTDADRKLALEIQQELNYAKVKVVLKKYNFPLTCTNYTIVLHKLIDANSVDLNDLKVVTNVLPSYINYGNVLYVDRCLRDCETNVAIEFFKHLSHKEQRILLKTVMAKYEQIINRNENDSTLQRNYLDFLKGSQVLNDTEIKDIENLYHLKNSYNIALSMNTMYNEKHISWLAITWMNSDKYPASSIRGQCISQLTHVHQTHNSVLGTLLHRTSTGNRVRKVIESLIINQPSDESTSADLISVLSDFKDGRNSSLLLDTYDVLIELVTKCAEESLHDILKYLTFVSTLVNATLVVKNLAVVWKFHYIYLPMSSIAAMNNFIDLYTNISATQNSIDMNFANAVNTNDFMLFRILANILESSVGSGSPICDNYYNVRDNAIKKLISKIVSSQELDEVLLTNLLLILNIENAEAEKQKDNMWIIDTLQGQHESLPIKLMYYLSSSVIRRTFNLDNMLPSNSVSYPPQYILKSKFNINLSDIALPENTEETWDVKVVLFYVLRQYPDTTLERLVDLCRTLNVTMNDGLSLQLISLLTTWELKYKIINDDLGCKQLYLGNDEKDIISKCNSICECIEDKEFIRDILNDFWKNGEITLHGRLISINPYYYEVYICIYYLILCGSSYESRNKKEFFLLNFLKEYKRISAPKQYEFELFSVKGMFPEIGYNRLPFHLFMRDDMWSNLKSEITLESYERWLPSVTLLSLHEDIQTAKDMICSNAVKQTMTSRKINESTDDNKENEPWRLTTREEPLLRAAHRCVRHIANMEWAGACLFYVLQGCARGADQVAAAHLCYQFAQRWAALQPGNRAVRQMERLHSTLSTRHALHKIEWACEEFVRLSSEPAQLIRALYLHPNIIEKIARHDVNRAANEIADKNGINVSSIRIQLLENILGNSNEENKKNAYGLDTKKLITAKYILKATCPKMGAIYLSRIAFDDESDFDKQKKLRALQCLMSVVEPDTALKVTNRQRDALWSSLLELFYIVNLENIEMPWLVASFIQNKIGTLEQLLQTAGSNVEGLKIAAYLAHRFGDGKIIRNLLPILLRAGLYEEIVPLLLRVSSPPDDLIYTAWRSIILSPFQRADYPITERQKVKCLNAINLLPLCPVIKDEDLIEVWKNCLRCKYFGLGCLVLPYVSPEKRQTLSELNKIDKRTLIASLKNLHSETYLASSAMYVVENLTRAY